MLKEQLEARIKRMWALISKPMLAHQFQFYGQFFWMNLSLNEITKNNGYWANKYGYQLGAKYIDAFTMKNLDLQVETNRVRPFTYSHYDSVANYTHYNQPLAHPLGANFQEFIGILKYQPAPKWYINARAIYYYQGLDSAGINFGRILLNYILPAQKILDITLAMAEK